MSSAVEGGPSSPWTWSRFVRIGAIIVCALVLVDFLLRDKERGLLDAAVAGSLRNRDGRASADACERMLFELPPDQVARAVVFVGSSITYGSNLSAGDSLPAQLARILQRERDPAPVFNCAQEGGRPGSTLAVAAAVGARPVALLVMEVLVPVYAERPQRSPPPWSDSEIAMLRTARPGPRMKLREAGLWPSWQMQLESILTRFVQSHWRLYRIRGSLWIDDDLVPDQLIWTMRRFAAMAGVLPKRFHGQTTNVGKLPWRAAYVGGQRPSLGQRFRVPSAEISESDYASLLLMRELLEEAGVPLVLYEVPINLPFQREFGLMSEAEFDRLARLRALLLERLAADGLTLLTAPPMPDDGFLDRAHLTAAGAERMARHLHGSIGAVLGGSDHAGSDRSGS